jgi:UDP-glucose 4-epimerase
MTMRVLVTGASGFVGRNVLRRLPSDWSVLATSRHADALSGFLQQHRLTNVESVHADLTDLDDVRALSNRAGEVDAVLYLAANGDPTASAARPVWDLESNTVGLIRFLEHVAVEHFVFVSSGAVYDGVEGPVTPATPVSPALPYAVSKLAAEHYVRFFADRRRALSSFVNVRFFGAYGRYEPERKITTRWVRAAMSGERQFAIRGDGANLIDFMHVDDAADGFIALLGVRDFRGTIDFGGGTPITVNELTAAMNGVTGGELLVSHQGHTEEYIRFRTVDDTMRARFGFAPKIPFEQGFARHYQSLRSARGTAIA